MTEENAKCELLYKKIQSLCILYPPTKEFKDHVANDMFLKKSHHHQAFFHVSHYLLNLYDAQEFHKTFCWPLHDRRLEADFRSLAVQYFNSLIEKHKMKCNPIKMHMLISPGGANLLDFFLELASLIIGDLIRKREKELGPDIVKSDALKTLNPHDLSERNKSLKEMSSAYIMEANLLTNHLRQLSQEIRKEFGQIAVSADIPVEMLTSKQFLDCLKAENQKLYEEKCSEPLETVKVFKECFDDIKQTFGDITSDTAEEEKLALRAKDLVARVGKQFPQIALLHQGGGGGGGVRKASNATNPLNQSLTCFVAMHGSIEESLEDAKELLTQFQFYEDETKVLESIVEDLKYIQSKTLDLRKKQLENNANENVRNASNRTQTELQMPFKTISTPLLKFDTAVAERPRRIAFLGNGRSIESSKTFLEDTMIQSVSQHTFDSNTTIRNMRAMSSSRIQLLRSVHKRTKGCSSPQLFTPIVLHPATAEKPKRNLFSDKDAKYCTPVKSVGGLRGATGSNSNGSSCPGTPFNVGNTTQIPLKARNSLNNQKTPSIDPAKLLRNENINQSPHLMGAVKKVITTTLSVSNASTSPSGRLDPFKDSERKSTPRSDTCTTSSYKENNQNLMNAVPKLQINSLEFSDDEENLFNISDTVINNIP